jgi:hypothetical protein
MSASDDPRSTARPVAGPRGLLVTRCLGPVQSAILCAAMLSAEQQASYDRDGYLLLRCAVPADACERMVDRLWEALGRNHGIRRDARESWTRALPRGFQKLCKADAFAEVASPTFVAGVDALVGEDTWDAPRHWGQPLVTFPTPGPWEVPARMWYLDYPVRGRFGPRFALKALCLLAPLEPRGGGTLLLEGSHQLATRLAEAAAPGHAGHSNEVRKQLAREHVWLRQLFSRDDRSDRVQRFMVEGSEIDGVRLRVVELTGEAGDALFFHPWLFHNFSPNCRDTPRMMLGQNVTTRAGLAIYGPAASP